MRAAAFPVEGRDDLTDPETLAFDYDCYEGDGPTEWWEDERYLLLYFIHRASAEGLPRLMRDLEGLRERATAQIVLAYADQGRRYTAPRRTAREAGAGERVAADQERFLIEGPGILSESPGPSPILQYSRFP